MTESYHRPVMLKECIDGLGILPGGIYIDATFGGGGHSSEILTTLEQGKVRGGRWHTLIDKVFDRGNMQSALFRVASNQGAAGVDHRP